MKFLFAILLIPSFTYCQHKYISLKNYPDKKVIEELKVRNNSDYCKLLIYQPPVSERKISSILIIENKIGVTKYWLIKNNIVIARGMIKNNHIFSYKNYLKTGAIKQEDKLKFVPPLMNGIRTENVIYEDTKHKFYFQYGENVTEYSPNNRLEKYRKGWLELIKSELRANGILEN